MSVTIQQPLTLATSQNILFEALNIIKGPTSLSAQIVFAVSDQNNNFVSNFTLNIKGVDFNNLWQNLNTSNAAEYIYQLGLTYKGSSESVPSSVANDFINS